MQTIVFYVSPVSRGSVLGVFRDRLNSMGGALPVLSAGVPCVLKLRLFDEPGSTAPFPLESLAGVTDWSFELDNDYDSATTVKLVADNADLAAATVTDGGDTFTEFSIPISTTLTEELAVILATRSKIALTGELVGRDGNGAAQFVLQVKNFVIRNRISDPAAPTPIPTKSYEEIVRAAVSGAILSSGLATSADAERIASGAAATVASGAVVTLSGGLQRQIDERPTSSGAETIASGAAANIVSGALVSGGYVTSSGASTIASNIVSGTLLSGGYVTNSGASTIARNIVTSGGYTVNNAVAYRGGITVSGGVTASGGMRLAGGDFSGYGSAFDYQGGSALRVGSVHLGSDSALFQWEKGGADAFGGHVDIRDGYAEIFYSDPDTAGEVGVPYSSASVRLRFSNGQAVLSRYIMVSPDGYTESTAVASGALLFEGGEIDTTVGPYRLTYTSSGGLLVSGADMRFQASSGAVTASAWQASITLAEGSAIIHGADGVLMDGGSFILGSAGTEVAFVCDTGPVNLSGYGGVNINGKPAAVAQVVTSTNATSADLILSGGTAYIFDNPVSALNISGAEVVYHDGDFSTEAQFFFTLASGGSVTIAPGVNVISVPNFTGGRTYAGAVNALGLVVVEKQEE